ncbi:MAG: RNB domain-containing ribonuclease [Spirochaetaceae bacterium]|nr:RNB domain-containing ribonuclease [Spirochaetaceae bacterium]
MIENNSFVIYKNQLALVIEVSDKFTVKFQSSPKTSTGKSAIYSTQKIREKDMSLLYPANLITSKKQLTDFSNVESKIQYLIDIAENQDNQNSITEKIKEVYELLISDEDTATQEVSFFDLAELTLGDFLAKDSWLFYNMIKKLPYFKTIDENFIPRSQDEINQILQKENAKENQAKLYEEFIKRLKQKSINQDDFQYMQEIEAYCLGKTDKSKILKDAGFSDKIEKVHKLLIDTGFWHFTKNPHPIRHGLSIQSAREVLPPPPEENRVEVSTISYAIDNEWSTDPDDAIGFDGEFYWVHVADPASTVFPDSKIDIDARHRGTTLYLPEHTARMLNEKSIEDYALGLTEKSKALSFKIKLDENANIIDTEVLKSIVNVKRLTYKQADEIKDCAELKPLFDIAKKYEQRRKSSGAIQIQLPEVDIKITNSDEEKNIVSIYKSEHTESSELVKEFMLMAGEAAARFAFKNQIPFPFISQDEPDIPKEIPEGLAGQYRLRRCMKSRRVGVTPSMHCSLGLAMYSQVTSPLRRYMDLIAHQQLRAFIDNKKLISKDEVLERISCGDAGINAAVKADRESCLHWKLVFLTQNPDWQGKAIAVEKKQKQTVFLIPELAMETILNNDKDYELNEEITVKAGKISIPELSVDFIKIL